MSFFGLTRLIGKALVALFLALLAWELVLEQTLYRSSGMTFHPELGRIYKAGRYLQGTEGFSDTRLNSLGQRGPELPPKQKGEYRVLVLGDSETEAFQVADGETYCDRLEAHLRGRFRPDSRVINGGRAGASPAGYIHLAGFYGRTVRPDAVVVQINDLDFQRDMLNVDGNFHVKRSANGFETVFNADFKSATPLLQRLPQLAFLGDSAVFRVAGDNLRKIWGEKPAQRMHEAPSAETAALVDWTMRSLRARYPDLIVVYLPKIDYKATTTTPSAYERLITERAVARGVSLIDMRGDFWATFRATRQPAQGFHNSEPGTGHINAVGHALVADRLADRFVFQAVSR